jgi:S1-C subfamily serine protease
MRRVNLSRRPIAFLLAGLVVLAGCAVPGLPGATRQAGLPSVVRVQSGSSFGSGFFVSEDLIATNVHVLAGADQARVSSGQGGDTPAILVYVDPDLDFAVLRSSARGRALPVRVGPVRRGEPVTALGFPQGRSVVAASTGTVQGLYEMLIIHDALIAAGSSGGPLVDEEGRVLGVNAILTKRRGDRANAYDRAIAISMTPIVERLRRLTR